MTGDRRRGRRRGRPLPLAGRLVLAAVVAGSAVGAALAGAEPTGSPVSDAVLTGGLAATVVVSAYRARRWSWVVAAGIAATAASTTPTQVTAMVALAVALVVAYGRLGNRLLGPLIMAAVVQVLLRLPTGPFLGASALGAAAGMLPVLISGYRQASREERRVARAAGGGLSVLLVAAVVLAAIAAAEARHQVLRALDDTRAALAVARQGDRAGAAQRLDRASSRFEAAASSLEGPLAAAGRVVPWVGIQLDAAGDLTSIGETLAGTAADALAEADLESITVAGGRVDLDLLRSFEDPLTVVADAVDQAEQDLAEIDSDWTIAPLATRADRLGGQLDEAAVDTDLALDVVRTVPSLLGADGARRYGVLFMTPAEARGLGGFVGSWGELVADSGQLSLAAAGDIRDLQPAARSPDWAVTGPEDYLARYGRFRPGHFVQDITFSPDFPSVAQVTEEIWPQARGATIDGVIAVDPLALAALLELTGPVQLPLAGIRLDAATASDLFLRDQYVRFADDDRAREAFLNEAIGQMFAALTSRQLPSPQRLGETLGPRVEEGRLAVHSVHAEDEALLARVGLDGGFPDRGQGDLLAVTHQNTANNKIDAYLEQAVDYRVVYDPETGEVASTASITLTNRAPASGLPNSVIGFNRSDLARDNPPSSGTNRMLVSLYTPLEVEAARIAGQAAGVESARELGVNVYGFFVDIGPGQSVTVEFELRGFVRAGRYELALAPQPLALPQTVTMTVVGAEGWRPAAVDGAEIGTDGEVATTLRRPVDHIVDIRFEAENQ